MTFKTFTLALIASFGFPWLMLVVVPFAKMRNVKAAYFTEAEDGRDDVYVPRRSGRITDGAAVYAANGCYVCHTQVIRPSFAGSDLGRPGWAGFPPDQDKPVDTRRETSVYDYVGEKFAQIGLMRNGPDLSNFGGRVERYIKGEHTPATSPEDWVYFHLYSPRAKKETYWSTCPSQRHLFEIVDDYGQGHEDAVPFDAPGGKQIIPSDEIRALASYLLSMKKDDAVPYAINFSRDKKKAE